MVSPKQIFKKAILNEISRFYGYIWLCVSVCVSFCVTIIITEEVMNLWGSMRDMEGVREVSCSNEMY